MELEEAIKKLKEDLESTKKANECGLATKGEFNKEIEAIEFVLTYITKQEKMIDLMAERIEYDTQWFYSNLDNKNATEIKQYFEKKAEEIDNK